MRSVFLVGIVLLCLVALERVAAQTVAWPSRGIGMATSIYSEYMNYSYSITPNLKNSNITDDGQGGMIMCWAQASEVGISICAQRVDGAGAPMWTTARTGVTVGLPTGGGTFFSQSFPACVSDNAGGAYITWLGQDFANGTNHPFIQHINSLGLPLWGASGVSLAVASDKASNSYPYIPQIDKDGQGGVWVTWYSYPFNSENTMYGSVSVAHLSGNGPAPVYAFGGAIVIQRFSKDDFLNGECNPVLCSDLRGDAFVAYQSKDLLSPDSFEYRNHIAKISVATGAMLFNAVATKDTSVSHGFLGFNIAPDESGGAILHYEQNYDAYVQYMMFGVRVNSTGAVAWGPKVTHQMSEFYQYPGGLISSDGAGGAYFLRYDNWGWYTPALQHIDSAGKLLWDPTDAPSGIDVATGVYNYIQNTQVITDPYGNAITAYANGGKIHLQKWDKKTGLASHGWPAMQLEFGVGTNPQLVSDGVGGAFVGWNQTSSGYDIYAQHVVDKDMAPVASPENIGEINVGNVRVGGNVAKVVATIFNRAGQNPAVQLPLVVSTVISRRGICNGASTNLPARIVVGDSARLSIRISPKKNGPFLDTVVFVTNDPFHPHLTVVIVGNGTYPHLSTKDTVLMETTWVNSDTTQRSLVVTNSGTDTLHITSCAFHGNDKNSFMVIGDPVQAIPPQAVGSIIIGFAPTDAKEKSSVLTLVCDDSSSPKNIPVSGQGIYPHLLAPTTLQFANTVEQRSSDRGLVVVNAGNAPLILSAASLSGANASEFSVRTSFPDTVAPSSSQVIVLRFSPVSTTGSRTATLSIQSNFDSTVALYGTTTYNVNLLGIAALSAPEPQLLQLINCGSVHKGRSDTATVHLTNIAIATPWIIASYTISGIAPSAYAVLDPLSKPDTLAAGASRDIRIRFTAYASGLLPATLEIASNAAATTFSVPIIGIGIKGMLRADIVDFGLVGANTCADTDLYVMNVGTDSLKITSIVLTGQNAGLFHTVGNFSVMLAPHEQATIRLQYCPVAKHADSIVAHCVTSDGDTIDVLVHGNGGNSGSLVAQPSIDFGLVGLQQNIIRQLLITNPGDIAVTIVSASFANGTAPLPFSSDIVTPLTVAPGDTVFVILQFKSNTGGVKTADLVLSSAASALTVALTGNVIADPLIISPRGLFDTTLVMGSAMVQSVKLANYTGLSRPVLSLAINGPGASSYSLLYPLSWPFALNGLSTDSILIGFRPFFPGTYLATLTIVLGPDSLSPPGNETILIPMGGRAVPPVGVAQAVPMPSGVDLSQNFPDPFSQATSCTFFLPVQSPVTMTLYDMLGRAVRELVHGEYGSGVHHVSIDGHGLPAGLYSCVLRTGGITLARMMQRVN